VVPNPGNRLVLNRGNSALIVSRDGTLWSRAAEGTFYLPNGATSFAKSALSGGIGHFANCADGRTWVADAERGVTALPDAINWISAATLGHKDIGTISVFCDREGGLWTTLTLSDEIGLFRIPDIAGFAKNGSRYSPEEQRVAQLTQTLPMEGGPGAVEDKEGNIWFGLEDGIERFRSNKLHSALEATPMSVPAIGASPQGDIWLADRHWLLKFPPHETKPVVKYSFAGSPESGSSIGSLWSDRDGSAWYSRARGSLWHYANNSAKQVPSAPGDNHLEVHAIVRDQAGDLWIAAIGNGLYRRDIGGWTLNGGLPGLPRDVPLSLIADANGHVWAGYTKSRVAVIEQGSVRMLNNLEQSLLDRVSAIGVRDGRVWLAGPTVVGLYAQEHFWPIATDGQGFTNVSGIVQGDDGFLWLSGDQGTSHISAGDISAFMLDHHHRVHEEFMNYEDGLRGAPVDLFPLPSAREGGDGRVWFTTTDGAYWIDPKNINRNVMPPPVLVTAVTIGDKNYLNASDAALPVHATSFEIDYTALSLSIPSRVRFKYKLEGIDADWQSVGSRREAFYTNVPPGQHSFQVIAANEDGVWNKSGASVMLMIPPAFYQTGWFLMLCCLVVIGLVWEAYRLRLGQIRARLGERLRERERIARELHDTLIQSAQGLILIFQGFAGQLKKPDPMRQRMETALDQADHLLNEARARVTELRTSGIDENVVDALTRAGEELFVGASSEFSVLTVGPPRSIRQRAADEIFRIGREALANAAMHADAKTVEVEIAFNPAAFCLTVRDDGRGISAGALKAGSRAQHFGLQGMRERAERINAQFDVRSRDGAGTEASLRVPAADAYIGQTKRSGVLNMRWVWPFRRRV
jgi:signal transduction histidine kinase